MSWVLTIHLNIMDIDDLFHMQSRSKHWDKLLHAKQNYSADEIIEHLFEHWCMTIPFSLSPWGACESIFGGFLYGEGALSFQD